MRDLDTPDRQPSGEPFSAPVAKSDHAAWRRWKAWVDQHRLLLGGIAVVWAALLGGAHFMHANSVAPNKIKWDEWQTEMAAAFKRIEDLQGSSEARVQAWKAYLVVYKNNNPFSGEDETLRATANSLMRSIDPEQARDAGRAAQAKPAAPEQANTKPDEMYDPRTNKTWQRCSIGQQWDRARDNCPGDATRFSWEEMRQQQRGGWRVPTSDEFRVYLQNASTFPSLGMPSPDYPYPPEYWTADEAVGGRGWVADFAAGANRQDELSRHYAVRLIRDGR